MRRPEEGLSDFERQRDPTVPWPYEESWPAGACPMCGGAGKVLEQIDRERYAEKVPCDHCQRWCATCEKHVPKGDHRCP